MRTTPFFWIAAAVVLSVVPGCGHGRVFQPAGWTCLVYHFESPPVNGNFRGDTPTAVSVSGQDAECLFDRLMDPFLNLPL
jgi:hypothetical protein